MVVESHLRLSGFKKNLGRMSVYCLPRQKHVSVIFNHIGSPVKSLKGPIYSSQPPNVRIDGRPDSEPGTLEWPGCQFIVACPPKSRVRNLPGDRTTRDSTSDTAWRFVPLFPRMILLARCGESNRDRTVWLSKYSYVHMSNRAIICICGPLSRSQSS